MRGIAGKRIIIGGAATGIGAALAARLAAEGALLMLGDVNAEGLDATAKALVARGADIDTTVFDLADDRSIEQLVLRCVKRFGGIDGLAIPAADLSDRAYRSDGPLSDGVNRALWDRTMSVNLIGHAKLIEHAAPHMKAAGGGAIVTLSSLAATHGHADRPAYAASKAGLHALVRHAASLYGSAGIRCNGVAPGLILTETAKAVIGEAGTEDFLKNTPLARHGLPEDVAGAIAFLLSDDSSWITGQILSVNGGQSFRD